MDGLLGLAAVGYAVVHIARERRRRKQLEAELLALRSDVKRGFSATQGILSSLGAQPVGPLLPPKRREVAESESPREKPYTRPRMTDEEEWALYHRGMDFRELTDDKERAEAEALASRYEEKCEAARKRAEGEA